MAAVKCPHCGETRNLWEGVEVQGWRALGEDGKPTGRSGTYDRGVEWFGNEQANGEVGCGECSWEGVRAQIVLGIDGRHLSLVHPAQGRIA